MAYIKYFFPFLPFFTHGTKNKGYFRTTMNKDFARQWRVFFAQGALFPAKCNFAKHRNRKCQLCRVPDRLWGTAEKFEMNIGIVSRVATQDLRFYFWTSLSRHLTKSVIRYLISFQTRNSPKTFVETQRVTTRLLHIVSRFTPFSIQVLGGNEMRAEPYVSKCGNSSSGRGWPKLGLNLTTQMSQRIHGLRGLPPN